MQFLLLLIIYKCFFIIVYQLIILRIKQMQNQTGYLFTLELRIRKQIVKLNVYDDDSLNDLIIRLSKTVQYKQKYSQRLKEKLQAQFKKLVQTQNCSSKVQSKLQSLTQQSKLIIIGVSEGQKNDQSLNETPFKILLDTSSANIRKYSAQNVKKQQQQYNYENYQNGQSPLIRKYNKKLTPQINQSKKIDQNIGLKYQYPIKDNFQYESSLPRSQNFKILQDRINLTQYSPIVNISSKRKNSAFQNRMQLQIIAQEEERLRKEGCIKKINGFSNYPQKTQFNYKESFQDYKIHKNKSQSALPRPTHLQTGKRNYLLNHQDEMLMAKHPQRLVYNQQPQALTKIDYSAKYIQGKPAAGTRGNKKFSYLSQPNF